MPKDDKRTLLLESIEREYKAPIEEVVERLYNEKHTFSAVAEHLGTTRQSLYNWIGTEKLQMIRIRREMSILNGKGA